MITYRRPKRKTRKFYLSKDAGRAIKDFNMIQEGDKILVAVSGGKDSLALLQILQDRLRYSPVNFQLRAVHIKSDWHCASCVHKKTLEGIFKEWGFDYSFEKIVITKGKDGKACKVSCFWCAWNRRKALFRLADKLGYNKIAMGHHMDDFIETTLLNLFFQGKAESMLPNQEFFKGRFHIIRPMVYTTESDIIEFAKESEFPSQMCACPNSKISNRRLMKELIARLQKGCPHVRQNLFKASIQGKASPKKETSPVQELASLKS